MRPIASRITAFHGRSFVEDQGEAVTPQSSVATDTGTVLKQAWMRKHAGAARLGTSSVGWEDFTRQDEQSVSRFMIVATTSLIVQMGLMKENVPSVSLGHFTATVTGLYMCIKKYTLL